MQNSIFRYSIHITLMDTILPPSSQTPTQYCISGNTIPKISLPWITITQESIQGKVCYTLTPKDSAILKGLRWVSRDRFWREYLTQVGSELLIREIRRSIPEISQKEIQDEWKKYFSEGYSEEKLDLLVARLHAHYGEKVGSRLAEWKEKNIAQSDIGVTVESIIDDMRRLREDPKFRRVTFQEGLGITFALLEKYTGARLGIVTFGWEKRADGWLIIKTPIWQNIVPPFLLFGNWYTASGHSLEEVLDHQTIASVRPVFLHYLIDTNGEIIGKVKTPMTEWTSTMMFPSSDVLRSWIRDPSLMPSGWEISLYTGNRGKGVTLTKMTPKWWFIRAGIRDGEFEWIQAKWKFMTIWYADTAWNLRSNISTTASKVSSSNGQERLKDITHTGASLDANWEWILLRSPDMTLGTRGHYGLSLQIGEGDINYTQSARMGLETTHFFQYQLSPSLKGEVGYGYDRLWSPNLFPNTFGKVSATDRNFTHFQKGKKWNIGLESRIPGWVLWGDISREIWLIMDTTLSSIRYTLGHYRFSYEQEVQTPSHPLLSHQRGYRASMLYKGSDVWISLGIGTRKIWDKRTNQAQIELSMKLD